MKKNLSNRAEVCKNSSLSRQNVVLNMWSLTAVQLFSTKTFCHNILSTSPAIYSQSAENRDKYFINFQQRVEISGKYRMYNEDQTNRVLVIRHRVLGQNVLVLNVLGLNSCAGSLKRRMFLISDGKVCEIL